MRKYVSHIIIGVVLVGLTAILFHETKPADPSKIRPTESTQFAQTSAMILTTDRTSGGSGVILQSTQTGSTILTNKHVCEVIQSGGTVSTSGRDYVIRAYKLYPKHDLCIINVAADLKINTVVASKSPLMYSKARVSGHPNLLPHVLTEGYFSGAKTLEIPVSMRRCTDDEPPQNLFYCMFMGGVPLLKKFQSQLVTATIMAGSSGSGVFNDQGEIAGLVFAGSAQGLSYAFIVPLRYVKDFTNNQAIYPWVTPKPNSNKQFFVLMKICRYNKSIFSRYCGRVL